MPGVACLNPHENIRKPIWFSHIFRGYKQATQGTNELKQGENYEFDEIIDISKLSNVNELYRTTAWMKRFCVKLKNIMIETRQFC